MRMTMMMAAAAMVLAAPALAQSDAAPAAAAAEAPKVTSGKMIYDGTGRRLGVVNRVSGDGSPQLIIDGNLVTLPRDSLALKDGKIVTALSRREIDARR